MLYIRTAVFNVFNRGSFQIVPLPYKTPKRLSQFVLLQYSFIGSSTTCKKK